ncbi:hypothetical protein LAJ19_09055 [Deinococcus taeanensis]|uniref:hypothetical protein n=1 Tax=Deinococcus taeanensis TaxID=2737050 RepID=UPI001CDC0654|nr:hypothetical protein [Deinococcus taeanensis]UBV41798.1 hypothetical protein LAJ19_09055 [Deinococcus taeanensis]
MTGFLLFLVLPTVLIIVALRMKPLVNRDEPGGDPLGATHAAAGMFGPHGLEADPVSVPEDTTSVRFDLSPLPVRERE